MKPNNLLKPILTIIVVLAIVGGFVYLMNSKAKLSQHEESSTVEETGDIANVTLESNINAFMEAKVSPDDLGNDNYHCVNYIYGSDSKYVYTDVYCMGFVRGENGKLEQGTGFSIPTRFEYTEPGFKIVNFTEQGEDDSNPSLREIFPKEFYDQAVKGISKAQAELMGEQLRTKAEYTASLKNVDKNHNQQEVSVQYTNNPENTGGGEIKNIVTSAVITKFGTKDGKDTVDLDFVTNFNNEFEYLNYMINNNDCTLPSMSKTQALEYVKKQLSPNGERIGDMSVIDKNCNIASAEMAVSGGTINQSSKVRTYPLAKNFSIINTCQNYPTLSVLKENVSSEDHYQYSKYNTIGYPIRKVIIVNGEVTTFDFVNGCAG